MATVITRGLAEITRLGLALGADASTFPGLAGMGDLMATCASPLSRNHTLGVHMGKGLTLEEAIVATGGTAEGVKSAESVRQLAESVGVEMPITERCTTCSQVARDRDLAPRLLARPARTTPLAQWPSATSAPMATSTSPLGRRSCAHARAWVHGPSRPS